MKETQQLAIAFLALTRFVVGCKPSSAASTIEERDVAPNNDAQEAGFYRCAHPMVREESPRLNAHPNEVTRASEC